MRRVRTDGKKILFGLFVIFIALAFATVNMAQEGKLKPPAVSQTQEGEIALSAKTVSQIFPKITITKDASGNVVFSPHSTKAYEVKLFSTYAAAAKYIDKMSAERKVTPVPLILAVNLSNATQYAVITPLAGCVIGGRYYPRCPR